MRKSGHRTFYNILHKQDKMAYTVPQFDPYIYLFAKQKNNEEGKRDISSWRGNVVEKKRRMIMKRFLLEEMKKKEGKGNNIWMSIFLAEEKKKREGNRGKYVLLEIIQIISNNLEPRRGSHQNFWDFQNLFHSAMLNKVFLTLLSLIIGEAFF